MTALSILVAAGPSTTVVQTVGASSPAALPRTVAGPATARVSRVLQTLPGQNAIRVQVPGARVIAGGPAGAPFTVIGSGPGPFTVVGSARRPFLGGALACATLRTVSPGGLRYVTLAPKAIRIAQVKLRGTVKLHAGQVLRRALRKLAAVPGHLPAFVRAGRVARSKRIIARGVPAPLAAIGGCRAIHVVAPPAGGR